MLKWTRMLAISVVSFYFDFFIILNASIYKYSWFFLSYTVHTYTSWGGPACGQWCMMEIHWKAQTQLVKFTAINEGNKPGCKFQMISRRIHLCATLPGYLSLYFYSHRHCAECWGTVVYVAVMKVQKLGFFFLFLLSKSTNSTFLQPVQQVCPHSGER